MDAARVLSDLMSLPPAERREVALRALESVAEPPRPELEEAWYAEVERRRRRLESGATRMVPWEAVRARLLADEP